MISKAAMGIAVGIAGVFVGYCIYFDKKRRNDPDFKKKLRERRKAQKEASSKSGSQIPDLTDPELVQKFFLQEVQLGEELLASGDFDGGIEHLANAVAVCGQPEQLLNVFQKTLPPQVFHLLVRRLPPVGHKLATHSAMTEEDVE